MPIKDLLVLVERTAAASQRLEFALAIAARFSARVTAMALVPHPYTPAMVGVHIPADLIQAQIEQAEREAESVLEEAKQLAHSQGLELATTMASGPISGLERAFARAAHHADFCVVGQPDEAEMALQVESAFLTTGRPALIVPYIGAPPGPVRRTVVAWNASREAARAAHDALPFLVEAEHTTVLAIDPEPLEGTTPGAELAAHLARHGVRVEMASLPSGELAIGDAILAYAADDGADLLVMGGYGHSRMREIVLGGATRQVLAQMPLPVLMSH